MQLSATIGEQIEQKLVRKLQAITERMQAVGLSIHKRYKNTWKHLLCFVYQLVYQKQQPALCYKLINV